MTDETDIRATGGCLCGAVRYEVRGPLNDVSLCHCSQCRRTHGHVGAYTNTPIDAFHLTESQGLKWYRSSASARRGFCGVCGASLFYAPSEGDRMAIAAGSIDLPTGLKCVSHLFVDDAADYYTLDDDLEKFPGWT